MYPKRGQITLFIIIGVIVLMVFLAVIFTVANVAKTQVKSEEERIARKAFTQEPIRIYIEDCFSDELQQGLVLLGKQGGKIWQEQGGRVAFEEGMNGLTLNPTETYGQFSTGRVAYGISAENYLEHPNAYPCNTEANAPEFCQYEFPETDIGLGNLVLRPSTLEGELKRFLSERTVRCVQEYIQSELATQAEVVTGQIDMDIRMHDEGISIEATYPLEFRSGGEVIFAPSVFDTFYPSKFKQLMDAAVTFPLQWDQKFVDFNYDEGTLTSSSFQFASPIDLGGCTLIGNDPEDISDDYFLCPRSLQADKYTRLGLEMERVEAGNGADVFIFRAPPNEIILAEEYQFRIARQNRPPALDYIHRNECLEGIPEEKRYDYLVIKGDEELGDIQFSTSARDADESDIPPTYFLDNTNLVNPLPLQSFAASDVDPTDISIPNTDLAPLQSIYQLLVKAIDIHGAEDWQIVRFLIDRPLEVGLRVIAPYFVYYQDQRRSLQEYFGETQIWLSKEDPFALAVQLPEESAMEDETAQVTLQFTPAGESMPTWQGNIEARYNQNAQNNFCFMFPGGVECPATADLESNPIPLLQAYSNQIETLDRESFLGPFAEPGNLEVAFSFPYCGVDRDAPPNNIKIIPKDCVPHFNPEHRFPYIKGDPFDFYQWNFDANGQPSPGSVGTGAAARTTFQGVKETTLNPFLATHACCSVDFTAKSAGTTCFESPWPGCYSLFTLPGETVPFTSRGNAGYVWEELRATCDGERGNVCGNLQSSLYKNPRTGNAMLHCGRNGQAFCGTGRTPIAAQCQGLPAYSFIEDQGWCQGAFGCSALSNEEVVYTGREESPFFSNEQIAEMATTVTLRLRGGSPLNQPDFPFHSSCSASDNGNWCDGDFDGWFDAKCDNGQCLELISCTAGQNYCKDDTDDFRDRRMCNSLQTGWDPLPVCADNEYCSEGRCIRRTCPPGKVMCYDTYASLLSSPDRNELDADLDEYNGRVSDEYQVQREELAFVCNARGSSAALAVREYELNTVEYVEDCNVQCSANAEITVVDIADRSEVQEDVRPIWVCRGCGPSDSVYPNNKPCRTIAGGSGVCTDTEIESPRFQCR